MPFSLVVLAGRLRRESHRLFLWDLSFFVDIGHKKPLVPSCWELAELEGLGANASRSPSKDRTQTLRE
jgi:hypothetical protein